MASTKDNVKDLILVLVLIIFVVVGSGILGETLKSQKPPTLTPVVDTPIDTPEE